MKAFVAGLGNIGKVVVDAMNRLGYEVHGFDLNKDAVTDLTAKLKLRNGFSGKLSDIEHIIPKDVDIVISCLPYFCNIEVAHYCIHNGIRYCDLGGKVHASNYINEYADIKATKPVFTDLGLAPGLVNILVEKIFSDLPFLPDDINFAVGGMGLNDHEHYPSYYTCNWSMAGLINEYFDDCETLVNGKIVKIPGFSVPKRFLYIGDSEKNIGTLFAINTSGGLGSTGKLMGRRGVKNCAYYTIRHYGHYKYINHLMNTYTIDDMKARIAKDCKPIPNVGDSVQIAIRMQKDNIIVFNDYAIINDNGPYSAMQECTAYPTAVIADFMARGYFDEITSCDYSHVVKHYDEFEKQLYSLGLSLL